MTAAYRASSGAHRRNSGTEFCDEESAFAARKAERSAELRRWHFSAVRFLLRITLALVAFGSRRRDSRSRINYLFDCIANSQATFSRNAARTRRPKRLINQAKYRACSRATSKTPEIRIRLAASKVADRSALLVANADGKEMQLDAWLTDALRAHRAATHS